MIGKAVREGWVVHWQTNNTDPTTKVHKPSGLWLLSVLKVRALSLRDEEGN